MRFLHDVEACAQPELTLICMLKDRVRAAWALAQLGCVAAAPLVEALILHLSESELKVRVRPLQ